MKKIVYYIFAIGALGFCFSCKREELKTYDIADNIYFNLKINGVIADSTNVSFAIRPEGIKDSILKLPVAVTGEPQPQDRLFRVEVLKDSSSAVLGTHFTVPERVLVRAGRVQDSIPLRIFRTPDLQQAPVKIQLQLLPTTEFKTDIKRIYASLGGSVSAVSIKVSLSDILTAGNNWNGLFAPYFGTFSVKKWKLINQVTGMPLDYVTTSVYDLQSSARKTLFAIAMAHYLNDENAAGRTVYEEDNTLMKMAAAYQ